MKRTGLIIAALGVFLFGQSAAAQSWVPSKRLTWNSGDSLTPVTAIDSKDGIHVIWSDMTPYNYELYYKLSTNGGGTWSPAIRLTSNSGVSSAPAMAIDSSNAIHVVWQDSTPGNSEIYYMKKAFAEKPWSPAVRLTLNSGVSSVPAMAIDSSNAIHVVWQDNTPGNYEIYYKKSTDGGGTWSSGYQITFTSGHSYSPAIAVDFKNTIHVVWQDKTSGNFEIYYKKRAVGAKSWSPNRVLAWTSGNSYAAAMATSSSSAVHVVWSDYTTGNGDIYYLKSTDGGTTWGSYKTLVLTSGPSVSPAMAIDMGGKMSIVWSDGTSGNHEICYIKSTDGGVIWSWSKTLTSNLGHSVYPAIAIDSSTNVHVLWSDNTPGNYEVYFMRTK